MAGNRYGRDWAPRRGYGEDFGGRHGPMQARGHGAGNGRRYDGGMRGYDRGWSEEVAYGREPGAGMMMNGPGMFTPFGWDPMLRWSGWDPLTGFIPYQDTPREWSYGLAEDYRRYDHDFYRGNTAHRYGGDYRGGYGRDYRPAEPRTPPRQSPLYGRGGDRALRQWARSRGYDVEHTIRPRPGPRR